MADIGRGDGWWHRWFLGLAQYYSTASKDPSTKVGAVITDRRRRIVGTGFNGFPQDMPDRTEWLNDRAEKYSRIIHGEVNALIMAGFSVPDGSTLYTWPFMPCDRCAVMMIQAGVKRFVAPRATADQLERWGPAFIQTEAILKDCGAELILMENSFAETI
jgi:dCMP deaminase